MHETATLHDVKGEGQSATGATCNEECHRHQSPDETMQR